MVECICNLKNVWNIHKCVDYGYYPCSEVFLLIFRYNIKLSFVLSSYLITSIQRFCGWDSKSKCFHLSSKEKLPRWELRLCYRLYLKYTMWTFNVQWSFVFFCSRKVLSGVYKEYDPLGLFAAVALRECLGSSLVPSFANSRRQTNFEITSGLFS